MDKSSSRPIPRHRSNCESNWPPGPCTCRVEEAWREYQDGRADELAQGGRR